MPLTVKEFKKGIEFLLESGQVSEDDYIFYHLLGEDEGNYGSLRSLGNLSGPNIKFFPEQKDVLDKLKKMKGVQICFISPNINEL